MKILNFTGKHLCRSLFVHKVASLKACNLLKETPTKVFSCDILKFLGKSFFTDHLQWQFLYVGRSRNLRPFCLVNLKSDIKRLSLQLDYHYKCQLLITNFGLIFWLAFPLWVVKFSILFHPRPGKCFNQYLEGNKFN